jgi:hypothetical protein
MLSAMLYQRDREWWRSWGAADLREFGHALVACAALVRKFPKLRPHLRSAITARDPESN